MLISSKIIWDACFTHIRSIMVVSRSLSRTSQSVQVPNDWRISQETGSGRYCQVRYISSGQSRETFTGGTSTTSEVPPSSTCLEWGQESHTTRWRTQDYCFESVCPSLHRRNITTCPFLTSRVERVDTVPCHTRSPTCGVLTHTFCTRGLRLLTHKFPTRIMWGSPDLQTLEGVMRTKMSGETDRERKHTTREALHYQESKAFQVF
jgi:hypothetical protein